VYIPRAELLLLLPETGRLLALLHAKKYAKFIDVNTIPDVMVPYTYQADRLKSKDYKGVITKDIVYKKYKDYELILTVDFAET
jgi:hypothetical protein